MGPVRYEAGDRRQDLRDSGTCCSDGAVAERGLYEGASLVWAQSF
jgi:hypothetical protein